MIDFLLSPPELPKKQLGYDWWFGGSSWVGGRTRTNAAVIVDEDLALTYSAVWCATRILSETGSMLRLALMQRLPKGERREATDHPKHRIFGTSPNLSMGSMAFREGRFMHQVNWGNGFAEIEWSRPDDPTSEITALWPIHPYRMRPARMGETDRYGHELLPDFPYLVRNNDGTQTPMRPDEILHIHGVLSEDGIWGKGVISYAREMVGMGIATERHGANYFGTGGTPRVVVKGLPYKDREQRQLFRQEWKQIHGSPDSGEVAVIPPGADFTRIDVPNEAAQFIETRKHNVLEVARWYRLPPHMLGDLEKSDYNSVEAFGIEFVIYSLMPWLVRWEEQLNLKLLTQEERDQGYFFAHDVSCLLRGDISTRYTAYKTALETGWLTINQICRMENLPDIGAGGDLHWLPFNNLQPVESLALPGGSGEDDPDQTPDDRQDQLEPGSELLDLPDVRQEDDYSCGAACAMSVGGYFGVGPASLEEWKTALDTTEANSTRPFKIVEYMSECGLAVTAKQNMTVDDLRECWKKGMPVICPVQEYGLASKQASFKYGHYVVVIGVALGHVFVQDPSIDNVLEGEDADQAPGRMLITEDHFLEVWHDDDADGKPYIQFGIAVSDEMFEEEEEPEEEEQPDDTTAKPGTADAGSDTDSPAKNRGEGRDNGLANPQDKSRESVRAVLADALSRMFTKEANAAIRAAKGKDWDNWLVEFYSKHRLTMAAALGPAVKLLGGFFDIKVEASVLAGELAEESLRLLRELYDTATPPKFQAKVEAWPKERAARNAEEIFGRLLKKP